MSDTGKMNTNETALFSDIKQLIDQSRQKVAVTVNAEMSMLYWHIGKRIREDVLHNKRAEYGKRIIATLAQQLTKAYGTGWSEKQLRHCLYNVEIFPDEKIFSALRRQLSFVVRTGARKTSFA